MTALSTRLAAAFEREGNAILPEPFRFLFEPARYKVAYGGRGGAKSWSFARALIKRAYVRKERILCAREFQSSISESVLRLLADQITNLGLDDFFQVQNDTIIGRNGSTFIFQGLKTHISKVKSLEGITITFIEEAENISENSWSVLLPTIFRRRKCECWIAFNPNLSDDPTYKRFVVAPPPDAVVRKVSWRDNPHFPEDLERERAYSEQTDPDSYSWIWEGNCRSYSDAQIFKNKFVAQGFDINSSWAGGFYGVDFGYARDPAAAVCCYIDQAENNLYIAREFFKVGLDIDKYAVHLEDAMPGIARHPILCDNSRPEVISYLAAHGLPRAAAADKWPGSVDDGILYLRAFSKIVVDPACKHVLDELKSYCFKTDPLNNAILPVPEDRHNHTIDAIRYALSPLIRNKPAQSYLEHRAMLGKGYQPVSEADVPIHPDMVFTAIAITERLGTSVAAITFSYSAHQALPLHILSYTLADIDDAMSEEWIVDMLNKTRRASQARKARFPASLKVEDSAFGRGLMAAAVSPVTAQFDKQIPIVDFELVERKHFERWPRLEHRVEEIRALCNSGRYLRLTEHASQLAITHRTTSNNHLVSQLLGYRPGDRDQPQELVAALAFAVLLTRPPY